MSLDVPLHLSDLDPAVALLVAALLCELLVGAVRLPPPVGFLGAGCAPAGLGVESPDGLEELGELGVTVLIVVAAELVDRAVARLREER